MWWKQVQNPQLNFQQFGLRGKGNGMLVFQFIYVTLLLSLTMSQLIKRNILFFLSFFFFSFLVLGKAGEIKLSLELNNVNNFQKQ